MIWHYETYFRWLICDWRETKRTAFVGDDSYTSRTEDEPVLFRFKTPKKQIVGFVKILKSTHGRKFQKIRRKMKEGCMRYWVLSMLKGIPWSISKTAFFRKVGIENYESRLTKYWSVGRTMKFPALPSPLPCSKLQWSRIDGSIVEIDNRFPQNGLKRAQTVINGASRAFESGLAPILRDGSLESSRTLKNRRWCQLRCDFKSKIVIGFIYVPNASVTDTGPRESQPGLALCRSGSCMLVPDTECIRILCIVGRVRTGRSRDHPRTDMCTYYFFGRQRATHAVSART